MEYSRNIILFWFEHEREGYKLHADCTVRSYLDGTFCLKSHPKNWGSLDKPRTPGLHAKVSSAHGRVYLLIS